MLALLVERTSSPQYVDGADIAAEAGFVFGSRTVNGTLLAACRTGSSTCG
jgi:hypothetical protein